MKVAIVSFGHADMVVSMAKSIGEKSNIDTDLYFTFSLDKKRNNIIDFRNLELQTGLQSRHVVQKAFSSEVKNYLKKHISLKLFIYKNLKYKSISNWFLSIKFSKILSKYDIIHFNGDNAVIMQLIPFLKNNKIVFTIHDFYPHSGEGKVNRIQKILRKYQLKSNSQIIIQNKKDYEYAKTHNPNATWKINFVPFSYLTIYNEYKFQNIKNSNYKSDILFFGRISKYKGIEYLIKSFQKVKKEIPNIKLIIAGGGKYSFNKKIYNNDSNIIFENRFISSDELTEYIKNTKIVVCPYIDATQSGVIMTAFAFNKPVIASNISGFKDAVNKHNGILVPPKDIQKLASAIIKLLKDENLRHQMASNIANHIGIENFKWENIAKQIREIYLK